MVFGIVVMVCSLAVNSPTYAQNALGNGRALDANLQRGSNGANPTAETTNFSARNDVVTGNVPGLGYFHGDVGYGASGSFGGSLGSEDLFRFRARSLSSTPSQGSNRGYALGSNTGQVSVYRSHTNTSAADLGRSRITGSYDSSGLTVRRAQPAIISTNANNSALNFRESYQQRIGVVGQSEGRMLEVTASPLLGIRHHAMGDTTERLDGESDDPATMTNRANQAQPDTPSRFSLPAVRLGRLVQNGTHQLPETLSPDRLVAEIEADMFRASGRTALPSSQDIYLDLLDQIQEDEDETVQSSISDQSNRQTETESFHSAPLITPSDQQLARARKRWQRAQQSESLGKKVEETDPTGQTNNPSGRLQNLLNKLDYDLPRVRSLASQKDTVVDQLMLQAQQEIQSRRYLDAEERYRHVLVLDPENPMAHVGLLHSQIGAGLFRSAEINLRTLFEKHPELIAARYDSILMPDHERLEWISQELMKLLESTRQAQFSLLLAYIGYQNNSSQLVQFALDTAGTQAPNDSLIVLLREIWLEGKP